MCLLASDMMALVKLLTPSFSQDLPVPTCIEGVIDTQQFGDAIMVLEFLQCFSALLDVKDTFPHGISFGTNEQLCVEKCAR